MGYREKTNIYLITLSQNIFWQALKHIKVIFNKVVILSEEINNFVMTIRLNIKNKKRDDGSVMSKIVYNCVTSFMDDR